MKLESFKWKFIKKKACKYWINYHSTDSKEMLNKYKFCISVLSLTRKTLGESRPPPRLDTSVLIKKVFKTFLDSGTDLNDHEITSKSVHNCFIDFAKKGSNKNL